MLSVLNYLCLSSIFSMFHFWSIIKPINGGVAIKITKTDLIFLIIFPTTILFTFLTFLFTFIYDYITIHYL